LQLSAEACGQISLNDRIIALNNTIFKDLSIQEVRKSFLDASKDVSNQIAMVTIESSILHSTWYRCPHCDIEVCIYWEEEKKLRDIYDEKILNGLEADLLCSCSTCGMSVTANNLFDV
jgi:phage terminase large subunit GpA-like protein